MDEPSTPSPRDARIRTLRRWRAGLALATVVLPLGFFGVFERHARRLDALAEHGVPCEATVTRAAHQVTEYAYDVGGVTYTWSAQRASAPYALGERFAITVLPEDPSLNLPVTRPAVIADEAARNRGFRTKFVGGLAAFLALVTALTHRDLRRAEGNVPTEPMTPARYRRRLKITGFVMAFPIAAITLFHAREAARAGESVAPVALGLGLSLAVLGGVVAYLTKDGHENVSARTARLLRVLWPAIVVVGVLRLVAAVFDARGR